MGDPERSVRQFREALKQDPELTHAWVGLAGALWVRSWESDGYISEDVLRSSKSALDRAIALSPNHAEAHVRLYGYYCHRFEMEKAQKHLDHAMEHGQKNVLVLSIVAGSLFSQSRVHEAIDLQRRAVALDPLGYVNRNNLAHFLYSGGLLDEALLEFNRSLDLNPEAGDRNLEHLTGIYVLQRRFDEAEKLARQLPKGHSRDRVMALIHNAEGREADVELILEGLSASVEAESAATLTEIYAQLVLFDESVHWLELATERKLITSDAHQAVRFLSTMCNSPFLIPLRGDPRWDEWLSRAEEQIAVRFSAESIVTAIDMPTSPVIEMTDR
jgi:tetratricopeptide (TPR) repeat protein